MSLQNAKKAGRVSLGVKNSAWWATQCIIAACVSFVAQQAVAQDHDSDFVDAFEPVDASAAAFHNEKFQEAERALLEGLSQGDGVGSRGNETRQPKPQPVLASSQGVSDRPTPKLREVGQPSQSAPVLQQTSLAERPERSSPNDSIDFKESAKTKARMNEAAPSGRLVAPAGRESRKGGIVKESPAATKAAQAEAQKQTPAHDKELSDLRRELANAKSDLAAAELEISRLSAVIQETSRARLSLGSSSTALSKTVSVQSTISALPKPNSEVAVKVDVPTQPAPDPSADLQVATVAVEKADLRLGAGRNHSALMSLRRGSRLAVEARQGEWYRVFAPNGQRAWIHASLVRFGDGAASLNDGSSVKVRGYDSKLR